MAKQSTIGAIKPFKSRIRRPGRHAKRVKRVKPFMISRFANDRSKDSPRSPRARTDGQAV